MADLPRKEFLLRAIAVNLEGVTIANGYFNDISLVDRSRMQLRDEQLPCFFINEVNEDLTYMPGGVLRSKWTYHVLGGVIASGDEEQNPSLTINKLVADYVRRFFTDEDLRIALTDPSVELTAALQAENFGALEHYLRSIRYDEGVLTPRAIFIATMELTYNLMVGDNY